MAVALPDPPLDGTRSETPVGLVGLATSRGAGWVVAVAFVVRLAAPRTAQLPAPRLALSRALGPPALSSEHTGSRVSAHPGPRMIPSQVRLQRPLFQKGHVHRCGGQDVDVSAGRGVRGTQSNPLNSSLVLTTCPSVRIPSRFAPRPQPPCTNPFKPRAREGPLGAETGLPWRRRMRGARAGGQGVSYSKDPRASLPRGTRDGPRWDLAGCARPRTSTRA